MYWVYVKESLLLWVISAVIHLVFMCFTITYNGFWLFNRIALMEWLVFSVVYIWFKGVKKYGIEMFKDPVMIHIDLFKVLCKCGKRKSIIV